MRLSRSEKRPLRGTEMFGRAQCCGSVEQVRAAANQLRDRLATRCLHRSIAMTAGSAAFPTATREGARL